MTSTERERMVKDLAEAARTGSEVKRAALSIGLAGGRPWAYFTDAEIARLYDAVWPPKQVEMPLTPDESPEGRAINETIPF